MDNYITGAAIKRLREEKGLTQSTLADEIGVSDKTISKWETAKGLPDISLLEPLSRALGVSVMELMSGNPRARFDLPMGEDFSVWDLSEEYVVDPADFLSMGKATPFTGTKLFGKCLMTVGDGKIVYLDKEALK